ncbi:MAG: MarR family winged helix-turn-helix transcriptional regulator [Deltaproteobacteria bacterium]
MARTLKHDLPRHGRPGGTKSSSAEPAEQLRVAVQRFVRSFGLLSSDQTPCGTPISTSYAHALVSLRERGQRGDPVSQQQLGEELGIDKSNVARLCAKMQHAGHITQQRSESDGRSRLLALTASGRRLAERVETASRDRFAQLLAALPSDDTRAAVLASLEALNGAILSTQQLENHP